jgi:hypothetical protein
MKNKSLSALGFLGFVVISGYALYSILSRLDLDIDLSGNIFNDDDQFDDE